MKKTFSRLLRMFPSADLVQFQHQRSHDSFLEPHLMIGATDLINIILSCASEMDTKTMIIIIIVIVTSDG